MHYIAESMEIIAKEASRQGFLVRQTQGGSWHFRKEGFLAIFAPATAVDVLDALSWLIQEAGLVWGDKP